MLCFLQIRKHCVRRVWSLRSGLGGSVGAGRTRRPGLVSRGSQTLFLPHPPGGRLPSKPSLFGGLRQGCGRGTEPLRLSWCIPSTERFYLVWHEEFERQAILTSNPIPSFNWLCDLWQVASVLRTSVCGEREGQEGSRVSRNSGDPWNHCTRPELQLQTLVQ